MKIIDKQCNENEDEDRDESKKLEKKLAWKRETKEVEEV
jgi:hypothetical protein